MQGWYARAPPAQQAVAAGLQEPKGNPGLQAPSLRAEVKGTLLGSRSIKGLHRPHGTPEFWEEKKPEPALSPAGPSEGLSSFALPRRGARQTARSSERFPPRNRKTSKPPTRAARQRPGGRGDSAKVIPSSRRGGAARPRLPSRGPSRPRRLGRPSALSASRAPPGPAQLGPRLQPRPPAGPRSPEGFSEAAARRLEPRGPPPRAGADPRLTRSCRPRAHPSRTPVRVRLTARRRGL